LIVRPLAPFDEVKLISPEVHSDTRGAFVETYAADRYRAAGVVVQFVQDNLSRSKANVLRGLHFQHPRGQAKLVRAAVGTVWDVVVDVRIGSPTFGRWGGTELSGEDQRQLYIPSGFAHGFTVLTAEAVFEYKCSDSYQPEFDRCLAWDDPAVGIEWPVDDPCLSDRDAAAPTLDELIREAILPTFES
jgi:dTDP-4-dehydrorhamnose 3,5-epimerase